MIDKTDKVSQEFQNSAFKKEYYFNGDCFATILPDCVIEAGPLEVVFEFYDKTDIFIHHSGQFLSPNSRSRVDVDKGKFVKIAVSTFLPKVALTAFISVFYALFKIVEH